MFYGIGFLIDVLVYTLSPKHGRLHVCSINIKYGKIIYYKAFFRNAKHHLKFSKTKNENT